MINHFNKVVSIRWTNTTLSISNGAECYLYCERFLVPYRSITLQSLTQCNINVQNISASTVRSEESGNTVVDDLCVVTKNNLSCWKESQFWEVRFHFTIRNGFIKFPLEVGWNCKISGKCPLYHTKWTKILLFELLNFLYHMIRVAQFDILCSSNHFCGRRN